MDYSVKTMIESQSGIIPEVLKAKTKRVSLTTWGASAKPMAYSGFPLKYFEDQTYLERIAEWF